MGIKKENLRRREHSQDELAHYARKCYDIDYRFPMGWSELEGVANRVDFDLKQHMTHSGKGLTILDEETQEHIVPCVIEPSADDDIVIVCTRAQPKILQHNLISHIVSDRKIAGRDPPSLH